MMRKLVLTAALVSLSLCISAQPPFPKSMKEDKDRIMSEEYWNIWNPKVQAKIDADIEANRKADAVIDLGYLPDGTEVRIEQVSHDFIFGAHIFNFNQLGTHERNERYKELYGTLFNSATIAFYWKTFEMQPDRLRFATEYWDTEEFWNNCKDPKMQPHWRRPSTDEVVEFCESKGIRLHGHTIIWGNRTWQHPHWIIEDKMVPEEKARMDNFVSEVINPSNNQAIEKYTDAYKALTNDQLSDALPEYTKTVNYLFEKRIKDLAGRYGGRINSWDVVNESSTDFAKMEPGGRLIKSSYGIMPADYTFKAFQTAGKAFPENVKLNINDYNMSQSYLDQVNDLVSRGCKIDIMGSQMHLFDPQQCLDIAAGKEIQTPDQVWKWADLLGQAGKPIHLSEITITAPGNDARGRQIQAIIAQNLYRLWFSIKPMMGITWWNVVDDCGAPGEPSVSGLFDRDMKPKASYHALDNLINNEWKTSLTVKVGKKGPIRFRGFKGNYKVSWKDAAGNPVTREFHLKEDGDGLSLSQGHGYHTVLSFNAPGSNQGVAVDDVYVYGIGNQQITKYSKDGDSLAVWKESDSRLIKHFDGGIVVNGLLYCSHSNFPQIPMASSIEVFDTKMLEHVKTISLGIEYGSCTWVVPGDDCWYVCFAHYDNNGEKADGKVIRDASWTRIVQYDNQWRKLQGWILPPELIEEIRPMSLSGGLFVDGKFYCTGHDARKMYVLEFPTYGMRLIWTDTVEIPFNGQGIALGNDGSLWGIDRQSKLILKAVR